MAPVRVVTVGRSGVDVYPLQTGVGLEDVTTFGKFLGGSPTNVAVAAARLGHTVASVTCVGDDPFGRFVRREMRRLGVDDSQVVVLSDVATPVTFCEIFPPDDFPLWFYGSPRPAHLRLAPEDLDPAVVHDADLLWITATGLSSEPSRQAHHAALSARDPEAHTVLDLDHRALFWPSEDEASRRVREVLGRVTVAVGNLEECRVAVGEGDPDRAADALLAAGVRVAVVKLGPGGVLAKSASERVEVAATPVPVVNGLGAGDAFGGGLVHGLLSGWDLRRTVEFASVAGAIVASRLECSTAMPTAVEVMAVLRGEPVVPRRQDPTSGASTRPTGRVRPAPVSPAPPPPPSSPAPPHPAGTTIADLVRLRAISPATVAERLRHRVPAPAPGDAPLLLIAADHPARGALAAGERSTAMADRHDLLARVREALARPGVGGFLGTADVVEDLALLGALEGKLVLGSMNRGGLAETVFELDDRFTGYDVAGIRRAGLDGGKMLLRIDPDDPASADTLEACARAVDGLAAAGLTALVEPFWSRRTPDGLRNVLSADAVTRVAAIASGLGRTSAYTWLKLPVVENMEQVMAATTLPTLVLGGDVGPDPDVTLARWSSALALPGVRGLVVGRSLLYPPGDDVAGAVDAAVGLL